VASARPIISARRGANALGGDRGKRCRQLRLRLVGRVAVVEPDRLLHRLEQRPKRDPFAVGQASSPRDERLPGDAGEELVDEPRLADPCGTENREELTGAVTDGLIEGLLQPAALSLAPDHW
jgi:hypothetical protein